MEPLEGGVLEHLDSLSLNFLFFSSFSSSILDHGPDPFDRDNALELQFDYLAQWGKLLDDAFYSMRLCPLADRKLMLKRRESKWRSNTAPVRGETVRKVDGALEVYLPGSAMPIELGLIESARHNDSEHAATAEVKSAHNAKTATIVRVLNNNVTGVISAWILLTQGNRI